MGAWKAQRMDLCGHGGGARRQRAGRVAGLMPKSILHTIEQFAIDAAAVTVGFIVGGPLGAAIALGAATMLLALAVDLSAGLTPPPASGPAQPRPAR